VGGKPEAAASAGLSQVETRMRRLTTPPCWPVRFMARMTKKFWSRSRLFTKRMISGYCPVMPASREISVKSGPAGPWYIACGRGGPGFEGQVATRVAMEE